MLARLRLLFAHLLAFPPRCTAQGQGRTLGRAWPQLGPGECRATCELSGLGWIGGGMVGHAAAKWATETSLLIGNIIKIHKNRMYLAHFPINSAETAWSESKLE